MRLIDLSVLPKGKSALVGVSGGVDSMVLLHVLSQHATIEVAHLNHRLRGKASDADERLVRQTAKKLGVPCHIERGDVKGIARGEKLSIEMAARKCRHEFFAQLARKLGIKTIALAHHADDQVELFLLRLLRGAGPEGLAGMRETARSPVDADLTIIRPLLHATKEEIRSYAAEYKIAFREDATNLSVSILRNRIRHKLVPLLKRDYQPGITGTVLRVMELLRAESDLVAQEEQRSREPFDKLSVAVQRRRLRERLHAVGIEANFDLVEHLRVHMDNAISVSPKRLVSRDAFGALKLSSPANWSTDSMAADLSLPGSIYFDGMAIQWAYETARTKNALSTEYFDAEKIGAIITLRHWQRGDRFHPIGMKQSVKLQDLFTNLKIPRDERHRVVVASTANGQLFWVEGVRISDAYKVSASSKRVLKWQWHRQP
ncbi:MAG TPA: tRNA lysidine(34) synthetase TilS [Candidatus Binatia bacterium]|nr:tRNA lysidine(34) synthetase TilS [Candidatus Binatia bacterium]